MAAATMLEMAMRPTLGQGQRSQQKIRVTPDEKLALEEAAARSGFKGVSDFVRRAALDRSTIVRPGVMLQRWSGYSRLPDR